MRRLMLICLGLSACGMSREAQLQRVAKDWCETIRASQVIPVYPLTEDLQPGDVFLVQTPVQRQEELYKDKGFLPLDQMVTRLHSLDFASFYRDAYFKGDYGKVPHDRPRPAEKATGTAASAPAAPGSSAPAPAGPPTATDRRFALSPVPMAAFPTYSFEVSRSAGMKLAIPVQGIPLGLGLMGSREATGTVTIADALTYGIDSEEALRKLHDWARRPDVRMGLADVASLVDGDLFLRIVTRVYFAGSINVLLQDARAAGGGLDAGEAKPIEFPDLSGDPEEAKAAVDARKEILEKLAEPLNAGAPGGSVRVAFASSRTVGLNERFPRPLAIGYLGFDVLVDKDGTLGPPVATRDILDPEVRLRPVAPGVPPDVVVMNLTTIKATLAGLSDDPRAAELARRLDGIAPSLLVRRVPQTSYDWSGGMLTTHTPPQLTPPAAPDFQAVMAQWSRDRDYVVALRAALDVPEADLKISEGDAAPRPATAEDVNALRAALETYEAMLEGFEHDLRTHPDIVEAVAHFRSRF